MIPGFIFFWTLGLAILFYMLWSNRMSRSFFAFKSFLQRLREAKDKTEFDRFMEERSTNNGNASA